MFFEGSWLPDAEFGDSDAFNLAVDYGVKKSPHRPPLSSFRPDIRVVFRFVTLAQPTYGGAADLDRFWIEGEDPWEGLLHPVWGTLQIPDKRLQKPVFQPSLL